MREEFSREGLEKQKTLIGEFIILFEDLNDWLRLLIPDIILKENPEQEQRKNIETLLTDITAEPLRAKFDSLIFDNFSKYPDFVKANKDLSGKISSLTNIRNSIVHGSYRLGWKNFQGELSDNTFSLRHSKSTKKGFEKRSKIIATQDLIELNKHIRNISSCYNLIAVVIHNVNVLKKDDLAIKYIVRLKEEVEKLKNMELKHLEILN